MHTQEDANKYTCADWCACTTVRHECIVLRKFNFLHASSTVVTRIGYAVSWLLRWASLLPISLLEHLRWVWNDHKGVCFASHRSRYWYTPGCPNPQAMHVGVVRQVYFDRACWHVNVCVQIFAMLSHFGPVRHEYFLWCCMQHITSIFASKRCLTYFAFLLTSLIRTASLTCQIVTRHRHGMPWCFLWSSFSCPWPPQLFPDKV